MRNILLMLMLLGATLWQPLYAQGSRVTGEVTDAATGAAIPGVNIQIKGTTSGTTTDMDGNYSLMASSSDVLVFSFIGYLSQEIEVGNRTTLNVTLSEDVQQLQEVVVVGYGTQEKKDVTGAVSSIDAENFNKGVINTPDQLFQGKLAGVQVTSSSGQPGAGVNITIRGASSIRSGNDPLIVVDGVPLSGGNTNDAAINDSGLGDGGSKNPLSFINPEDIESMDILKDASATAIYGSRGANGVILITTKKGKEGKGTVTYNGYGGASWLPEKIDLLSADNYVERAVAAGAEGAAVNYGGSTDWQDEIYRTGITQSHSVAFGGGSEKTQYRFSLSYLDQEGIIENSDFERYTARINGSHNFINDKLTLDFQLTAAQTNSNNPPISNNAGFQGSLIGAALQANPTIPIRDANGNYVQGSASVNGATVANDFRNPVAMLDYITDTEETFRMLGNVGLSWEIIENLTYRVNLGVDKADGVRRAFYDPRLRLGNEFDANNGRSTIYNRYNNSWLIEHFLTYNMDLGNNSSLDLLGGYSYQEFRNRGHRFGVINFPETDDFLGFDNVDGGQTPPANQNPFASDNVLSKLQSYFTRANLNLLDKYLLTATLRVDGSSKFGEENRYGVFPALGLGWRISDEDFAPGFFSNLKLRGGWGITGNQEIPAGLSTARYQIDNNSGALTLLSTPNPEIQWEETRQYNIGVDWGILGDRVTGTIDYFNKNTTDLLIQIFTPQPAPTQFIWTNLDAEVINTGLEVSVDVVAIDQDMFNWTISANLTNFFTNEVKGLGTSVFNTGEINGQGLSGAYAQRIADGQPLYVFYMQEFEGISGDGTQQFANDGNLSYVASPHPDIVYGFTNNLSYGNFDLAFTFNGRAGNYVYNNTANALFLKGALRNGRNVTEEVAFNNESPNEAPIVSTRYLEKGDFLRLNNATIGYSFNTPNVEFMSRARVYVSGQNLLLFTDYSGYDPEVNVDKNLNDIPSLNIDYTGYPRARTIIAGINVTF